MRIDHAIIENWVKPNTRVLDLGCGDGTLLKNLQQSKAVHGYGLEINSENILRCVANGVNIVEQNIDEGLSNFDDQSFDTVIMSQTIQTMQHPDKTLLEMLRVGKECIVTFPNFGHWRARFSIGIWGQMPVSEHLPFEWFSTPNIHFCTFRDFDVLCKALHLNVLNREVVCRRSVSQLLQYWHPNLFGETALYRLVKA
ncbi:MAG: methionine biosynthesis protein MetW [Alteromonadaceae bacterium]|nr:MAG: methionine biosynthesis protein MetW [Alteromonadaceae bacterium]